YKESVLNGRPGVYFDGVDDFVTLLNSAGMAIDNTCTMFFVYRSIKGTRQCLLGRNDTAGAVNIGIMERVGTREATIPGAFVAQTATVNNAPVPEVLCYRRAGNQAGDSA